MKRATCILIALTALALSCAAFGQAPPAAPAPPGDEAPLPALAAADIPADIAWGPGRDIQAGVRLASRYGHPDQRTGLYVFAVYLRNRTARPLTVSCPSFAGISVPGDRISYTTIVQTESIHCTPHIRDRAGRSVAVRYRPSSEEQRYSIGPGQAAMVSHWMLRTLPLAAKTPDTAAYTQTIFVAPGTFRLSCDVAASWGRRSVLRTGSASFDVTEEDLDRR